GEGVLTLCRFRQNRDHDERDAERAELPNGVNRVWREPDLVGIRRRLEEAGHGVEGELVDQPVPVEEDRPAHEAPTVTDSHLPDRCASAGCETSRCQTTAWNSSTCGVSRLGSSEGTTRQRSANCAVAPSSLPTMPSTVAPISFASSTASTMLRLIPCSREPPPTEKTK